MSDSARAVIFGRDAAAYERSRPTYPREAIEHLVGLTDAASAIEVGAGTGKATVDIARAGLRLTCLEPSAGMARILAGKGLPGVDVVVSTFEDWEDGDPRSFDLIYAAQAWHWVDHGIAYRKALELLRPDGALALMWNIPQDRYGAFEAVYEAHAPNLIAGYDPRIEKRDSTSWLADMAAAGLADVDLFTHRWSTCLDADGVRTLYSTYSDHMMLPEPQRARLLDGLAQRVEAVGGTIEMQYRTNVFTGRAG